MIQKKFKVRVVLFVDTCYKIQYSYGYITSWKDLNKYEIYRGYDSLSSWTTILFLSYRQAESFAEGFKTINDIHRYYEYENEKKRKYLHELNEQRKRKRPYISKIIASE